MKIKNIVHAVICAAVLVLEILPFGAVLNFATPDGEPIRRTFSYFDLTPFGYASFGPFLTALVTLALCVFAVLELIRRDGKFLNATRALFGVGVLTSIIPLMRGFSYASAVGIAISVLLAAGFCLSFVGEKS